MTFAQSGTNFSVQAALGTTASVVTSWVGLEGNTFPIVGPTGTNFPLSLSHGALESNWPDPGLINQMNVAIIQQNYQYRI